MSKVKQIIRLRTQGVAIQTISKSLDISRNTVKKYLRLVEVNNHTIDELLGKEDEELEALLFNPDPFSEERYQHLVEMFPYIEKELKRTGVNRWILWAEYKEKHPGGYSYPHFCAILRHWKGTMPKLFGGMLVSSNDR